MMDWMRASVWVSTEDVASSNTRIGELEEAAERRARARQKSWSWPCERGMLDTVHGRLVFVLWRRDVRWLCSSCRDWIMGFEGSM